ncbi:hypothetical protein V866_003965 [Kwoniella sp. B9012]|uniref:BZIP domain-containing protein n=1 Tax=Kwoniella europaea PYCC6329 TaxID=1423913 RepID=A0AAX4KJS9_9TREE
MNPIQTMVDEKSNAMSSTWGPAWGSYLYQNFLLSSTNNASAPAPTTLDWLNATSQPLLNNDSSSSAGDYFGLPANNHNHHNLNPTEWADNAAPTGINVKTEVDDSKISNNQLQLQLQYQQQQQQRQRVQEQGQAGPSSFFPQFYFPSSGGINTSLLTQTQNQGQGQNEFEFDYSPESTIDSYNTVPLSGISTTTNGVERGSTDSVHMVDNSLTRSPSPISSLVVSPHESPLPRPIRMRKSKGRPKASGKKRSHSHSILSDSEVSASHSHDDHDHDHDHEHEPEVPEGVERDGMIWGMKVEDYRALSARERKRVRNRISARTFRAKRKEHLTSLEHDLGEKDLQIKIANDEANRLRKEVVELKRKLAKYEKQY